MSPPDPPARKPGKQAGGVPPGDKPAAAKRVTAAKTIRKPASGQVPPMRKPAEPAGTADAVSQEKTLDADPAVPAKVPAKRRPPGPVQPAVPDQADELGKVAELEKTAELGPAADAAAAGDAPAARGAVPGPPAVRTLTLSLRRPSWLGVPGRLRRRKRAAGASQQQGEAAGRGFARLTVLPALLIVAWLLTGLPLLLAGHFEPVPMLLIAAPLATALAVNVLHRIPGGWPVELPGGSSDRAWTAWAGAAGTVLVAAGFAAWQLAGNSPSAFATRTPGVYFQAGYWIAQHGSLPIPGSLGAFGGAHPGMHLSSIGFVASGHSVVPEVTAGLPMLLAGGFWTSGTGGGTVISPVLGALAVLSFGGLVGRLAGRRWAPAGALALALTLPELYTSRDAFAEPAVQILLFGGLSLAIDALTTRQVADAEGAGRAQAAAEATLAGVQATLAQVQSALAGGAALAPAAGQAGEAPAGPAGTAGEGDPADVTEPIDLAEMAAKLASDDAAGKDGAGKASVLAKVTAWVRGLPRRAGLWLVSAGKRLVTWPATVQWRTLPSRAVHSLTPEPMLATLGGLAIGLTSLLTLSSLVYLVPVIVAAAVVLIARRAAGVALILGVVIGLAYGLASAYLLARPLADATAPLLKVIGENAGGVLLLTIAALLLRYQPKWLSAVRKVLAKRPLRWLPGLAAFVAVVAFAGLAIRPYLQVVRGVIGQGAAGYVAILQHAAGLKVEPARLYSEDTLYWVIWYAGIATVLLGGFGAAVLLRRCLRSLLTWQDDSGTRLNWALPLIIILGGSGAVLWDPATVPDQPWASRRLVPVVIPGLILLATWAAAWLTRRARDRGAGVGTAAAVGAFCVGAMVLPSVTTSFGFGLSHSGPGGGLRASAGGLAQHRVGVGQLNAVRGLCAAISGSSSVLIVDQRIAQVFAQVIRGECGVPVAWMSRGASAVQIDGVLGGILKADRRPVVLGARPDQVGAFGGSPTLVLNLATTQNSHELTQPAGAPWPARYQIWMAVASSPDLGA